MTQSIDNSFQGLGVPMRRFYLRRIKDETGISRTGRVLEGVLTQSGKVLTEWRPPHSTMGIYNSLDEFRLIHVDCHPSCNEIVWLDPEDKPALCATPGCGHPKEKHGNDLCACFSYMGGGDARRLITGGYCPCTAYTEEKK